MHYTELQEQIKKATLFELYRLSVFLRHEMSNPERLAKVRAAFKVGDQLQYFDARCNALRGALILDKHRKYVRARDLIDGKIWRVPYQMLRLEGNVADLSPHSAQTLDRHSLQVGELIGFNKDGSNIYGKITRLNQKTVSLMTADKKLWRVSYSFLFKVIDGEVDVSGLNAIKFINQDIT